MRDRFRVSGDRGLIVERWDRRGAAVAPGRFTQRLQLRFKGHASRRNGRKASSRLAGQQETRAPTASAKCYPKAAHPPPPPRHVARATVPGLAPIKNGENPARKVLTRWSKRARLDTWSRWGQGEGGCSWAARVPLGRTGVGASHPGRGRRIFPFRLAPSDNQAALSRRSTTAERAVGTSGTESR